VTCQFARPNTCELRFEQRFLTLSRSEPLPLQLG
jgi:hypothetical protein